jgi:hypothetical protein
LQLGKTFSQPIQRQLDGIACCFHICQRIQTDKVADRREYLKTLRRDRPYERLNISGIKGLTSAQKATLLTLGAVETDSL